MSVKVPDIASLRKKVVAAREEFDMAVQFHEMWKPSAYDKDLHKRMGRSYATQAFLIMRMALRRETLLALMRLWDRDSKAVGMELIAETLRDKCVIDALVAERMASIRIPEADGEMREEMSKLAMEAIALASKYSEGGSSSDILKRLRRIRDKSLAHREAMATAPGATATEEEIESFYQDNLQLVRLLLSLVEALAYNPDDSAGVFRHYAMHFWAGVSGEQTEGHPNYRVPPRILPAK
jgi:hypothetical protein